jgi:DNA-binding PadR family transcriptional regulator
MPKKALESLTESMFYVLMAFRGGAKCGIDVAEFVEKKTGGLCRLGPATLYTILAKFETEKYIREIQVDGRKRTYEITDKGLAAYYDEVARLRRCLADADSEGGACDEME